MRGLSLVAASGGHSSSRCAGLSLSQPHLLRSTGSRRAGSVTVAHGPSCSAACEIFPDQGSNPCPLQWQADSQPLRHQGSPKLIFLKAELIMSPSSLRAYHSSSLHYIWRLTSSGSCPCSCSSVQVEGGSLSFSSAVWNMQSPWCRRRETEDSQVGSPLSTKSGVPSPSVRGWEAPSGIHPEGEEDILLGNTIVIDPEMCLPDPPSRKGLLPNFRELVCLSGWELPCLRSRLSWGSPLVTEWGRGIKTWPFWPMHITPRGTAHLRTPCWGGQGFLVLASQLTSSSSLSCFTISFIGFDPLWTSCTAYSTWYLLLEITTCNN